MASGQIEILNMDCGIFTAFRTVGAVIVALWLSYKESKPKLKIYATLAQHFLHHLEYLSFILNTSIKVFLNFKVLLS